MPNQPYKVIADLARDVDNYLETYVKDAEAGFPLDNPTIQKLLIPPRALELLEELTKGFNFRFDQQNEAVFGLPDTAGVIRSPQLHVEAATTNKFYLPQGYRHTNTNGRRHWFTERKQASLTADLTQLTTEQVIKLNKWVDEAITTRRVVNLIVRTVRDYMVSCEPSLWHVMVQMPVLKLGFDSRTKKWANDSPRHPHHYTWHAKHSHALWHRSNEKFFNLIERVMLETSLLKDVKNPRVRVYNWVRLGGEDI